MSYAIGEFIYGIKLTDVTDKFDDIDEMRDSEVIHSSYSGSGEMPVWLGSESITDIDECNDMDWAEIQHLGEQLKAAATVGSPYEVQFQKNLKAVLEDDDVAEDFKDWLKTQTPQVHLLWGSS